MAFKLRGLFSGLSFGKIGSSLSGVLSKFGTTIKGLKISWPSLGKITVGGGLFAGIYAGIKNGVSSAFNGGSSFVQSAAGALGVDLTDSQSNFILVVLIVVIVAAVVIWLVRRGRR